MTCDHCGNEGASIAPRSGVLCDCCFLLGIIGPHECLSHLPARLAKEQNPQ